MGCRRYYQGSAWCGRLALRVRGLNLAKRVGVGAGNGASRKGAYGELPRNMPFLYVWFVVNIGETLPCLFHSQQTMVCTKFVTSSRNKLGFFEP